MRILTAFIWMMLSLRAVAGSPARVWLDKGDREAVLSEARQDYRKAVEVDPKSPEAAQAWQQLGKLEFNSGAWKAASEAFGRSAELAADPAEARYFQGRSRQRLNDAAGAEKALTEALARAKSGLLHDRVLLAMGDLRLSQGKYKEALESYTQAGQGSSGMAPQGLWKASQLLESHSDTAAARSLWTRLLEGWPESLEADQVRRRLEGWPAPLALASPEASSTPAPLSTPAPISTPAPTPSVASKPSVTPSRHAPAGTTFTIQVGAYSSAKWAGAMAQRLSKRYKPVLQRTQVIQGNTYYLVSVGKFASKKDAQPLASKLAAREKITYVIRESN